MAKNDELYNGTFALAIAYNFFLALNFTNNAIYPLYVKEMGGNADTVGYFMGIVSLAAVVFRPVIGYMIDRWGVKPVLLMGSLTMTLPSLGYWLLLDQGLSVSVWLLRLVHGFGFGAHFSAFFTLAAQTAPPHRRNEAIAMYGFSGLGANLVGPYLGEVTYLAYGVGAFFLLVTAFGLVAVALIAFVHAPRVQDPQAAPPTLRGATHLLLHPRLRFVFVFPLLLATCFASSQFFLAPLAQERLIANFGLYFTGYSVAGMAVRLISRKWGDRFGVRRIMVPAFLLYGAGMFVLYFSYGTVMVILSGVLAGAGHGIAFPAVQTLAYSKAPRQYGGSVIALMTGMMDFGNMITAFALGILARSTDYGSVFLVAGGAGLLASALALGSVLKDPERVQVPSR